MTATLEHVGARRADQLPPILSVEEVNALITGAIAPPTPRQVRARPALDTVRSPGARRENADPLFARQHSATADLPDPRVWVQRFATALVEVLDGRRPPTQLARHVDADVLARVTRRYRATRRRGGAPGVTRVRRVRICEPRDGVIEAAVVARVSGRPCPIAMRLNGTDGRWMVTVLEML